MRSFLATLLLATSCEGPTDTTGDTYRFDDSVVIDAGGDAAIGPDIVEDDANGVDDDCDGAVDEGAWQAGDLVITEILADPIRVSDADGEWFEVLNASDRDADLTGLTITTDDGLFRVPAGAPILASGARAVFGADAEHAWNGGFDGSSFPSDAIAITGDDASVWPDQTGAWRVSATARDAGDAAGRTGDLAIAVVSATPGTAPVADPGPNQSNSGSVTCANGVGPPCAPWNALLDGSASTDADGDRLFYAWTLTSGQAVLHDRTGLASAPQTVAITNSCTGSAP